MIHIFKNVPENLNQEYTRKLENVKSIEDLKQIKEKSDDKKLTYKTIITFKKCYSKESGYIYADKGNTGITYEMIELLDSRQTILDERVMLYKGNELNIDLCWVNYILYQKRYYIGHHEEFDIYDFFYFADMPKRDITKKQIGGCL